MFVTVLGVLFGVFFFIISILTIILLFLYASVSRIVLCRPSPSYSVLHFCAAIVPNKLLIILPALTMMFYYRPIYYRTYRAII